DNYDDIDPSFVPNTNSIVFSSNRVSDTLGLKPLEFEQISDNYNLYIYNLDTTKNILKRITNTVSRDIKPMARNSDEIYYLSDQKGIFNLFRYNISNGIYRQITNYKTSINHFHPDFKNEAISFVAINQSKDHVFYFAKFDFNQQNFTPPSGRKQLMQARMLKKKTQQREEEVKQIELENKEKKEELSIKDLIDQRLKENKQEETQEKEEIKEVEESLDTDNYVFDAQVEKEEKETTDVSILAQYRKLRQKSVINGPFEHETLFSADNIIYSPIIDPYYGFAMVLQTEMKDLLENHRFHGGVTFGRDLRSGKIFGEYQNLTSLIDYSIRFDRNILYWEKYGDIPNPSIDRYGLTGVQVGAAYPFNTYTRLAIYPFVRQLVSDDMGSLVPRSGPPTFEPSKRNTFAGGKMEFVFDNSSSIGMNIKEGTKGKIVLEHFESLTNSATSFSKISLDFRHYQKLHREINIATRIFAGKYFGNSPKYFLLGGTDNWLFRSLRGTEDEKNHPLNPENLGDQSNLLFHEFTTNIRGFDYGELHGNNVFMLNMELRIPLVQYLSGGYIASNFFRNVQFTGFFDVGSSWTGPSPFNPDNTIGAVPLDEIGPFKIIINNYKDPWLASTGIGFRSMIFGYYTKIDLAWPMANYKLANPRLVLSLGYDF
ncbi:MAG: hypothetical protein OEY34_01085, partial [Cyclobacteriaceae bacterium]|nr:hypothetical protein [Cyclobacteriaceae bacterium]